MSVYVCEHVGIQPYITVCHYCILCIAMPKKLDRVQGLIFCIVLQQVGKC